MIKKILYFCLFGYVTYISILLFNVSLNYTTTSTTIPRRIHDNFVSYIFSLSLLNRSSNYSDGVKINENVYTISLVKHKNLRNTNKLSEDEIPIYKIHPTKPLSDLIPLQILLWNNTKTMFEENEVECKKKVVKIKRVQFKICLRNSKDIFSDLVRVTKSVNCPVNMIILWNEQVVQSHGKYMEIGAGIGNCLMKFLHYQIQSIAFEPVPQNLYLLTKSILMNNNMKNYLTLFGNALGGYNRHGFIYSDSQNWMDSTMNKNIDTTNPIANNMVDIFTLDSIITEDNYTAIGNISVLSVDVNGYEYHVLTGAVKLLNKKVIKSIFCKIDCDKLSSFNVDVDKLFSFLEERKYVIENKLSCSLGLVYYMIARLKQ